jgi:hypothetical protein
MREIPRVRGFAPGRGPRSRPDRDLLFRIFEPVTGRALYVTDHGPDRDPNVTRIIATREWDSR